MKKICAMLFTALMLLTACSAEPYSSTAPGSTALTGASDLTENPAVTESETEEPTTEALPKNEIIIWTVGGEEDRTKTICEYCLGKPQQPVPVPEGGWTVTVKTVSAEELIRRMQGDAEPGTPESEAEVPSEGSPQGQSEAAPEGTAEAAPEGAPQVVPEGTAEAAPEDAPQAAPEGAPKGAVEGEAVVPDGPDAGEMPDLFFFSSDDFEMLKLNGLLSPVPEKTAAEISRKMAPAAVEAAGGKGGLSAYPAALDHAPLLYYDKSVVSDVSDLASVIAQCGKAGRCFYTGSDTLSFPSAVFLSCGLTYETELQPGGRVKRVNCDYYSEKGLTAAKLIRSMMSMDAFRTVEGSPVLAFSFDQDKAGAMIAASYQTVELRGILGDDYAVAALPPILDGETAIPESSYGTFTMIGVMPNEDENKLQVCHMLAAELVSNSAQRARFDANGTIPVRTSMLTEDLLGDNKEASALVAQMPYVLRKIRVSDNYDEAINSFTAKLLAGGADMKTAKIQQLLDELSAFLMADVPKVQE